MAIRVALITPPLDSSGGIGRLMSYVAKTIPADDVAITLLDPRGRSQRPILSIFPLVGTWMELIMLGLTRRVDVAHINMSSHGSSIRKPVLLWTCKLLRIPVVLHLHASEYPEFFEPLPRVAKTLLRRTFSSATLVLVLGSTWRDYVHRELGVPTDRVVVLLNGAPGPARTNVPQARRPDDPLRIVFLGRLGRRKGVPELLQALADSRVREKPWLATFAGDGDVDFYRDEARGLGLEDRVRFEGWLDTPAAHELLLKSDLLVLPSHAEGLPMSIIEAFAHGVPVVSTPVGSIPDVLEHGVNGLLVDSGNSTQLTDAFLRLLEDERLRSRLAENARRTWEHRLDIASYARELALCWNRVAESTQRQWVGQR
jgi:glycosyltransferase involved in cell wall biosynthesis